MISSMELTPADGRVAPTILVSTLPYSALPGPFSLPWAAGRADGIELFAEGPAWRPLEEVSHNTTRQLLSYRGTITLHAPIGELNLSSVDDPELREFSLRVYSHCLRIAAAMGALHVVIHTHHPSSRVRGCREAKSHALDAMCRLGREAESLGLKVALENVGVGEHCMFDAEEFVSLFRTRPEGVCALLDVGHAHLNGWDIPSVIRGLGKAMEALHLHDNLGEEDSHYPIGLGTIPWATIWPELQAAPQQLRLVLEYGPGVEHVQLADHISLLKSMFSRHPCVAGEPRGGSLLPMAS